MATIALPVLRTGEVKTEDRTDWLVGCFGFGWLVGCFGFNGPFRQYFSLYRAVSQREGEREEKRLRRVKMSKQPLPAPNASTIRPCPTIIQIVGRPGTGSLPSTITPPDHPPFGFGHRGDNNSSSCTYKQAKHRGQNRLVVSGLTAL